MKIAIQNSWPNLLFSAENEFISRVKITCANIGWECVEVVTSGEIIAADPDCVLTTHEFSTKLTTYPTIGILWSPPDFYRHDASRIRSILSYDGYLAGSESIRRYLRDLLYSTGKNTPISAWNFLPTAPLSASLEPRVDHPTIFYAGIHWDGERHGNLLSLLANRLPVAFYGDPEKWAHFGSAYRGSIPFDGSSVFETINAAGIALCMHRKEHLTHDAPSMRMFEAAAAGAVIITEDSPFARKYFGDCLLYIDGEADSRIIAEQIEAHYKWVCEHPEQAKQLARLAQSVFQEQFCLELLLKGLPGLLDEIRVANHFVVRDKSPEKVEVIVRVGSRSIEYVRRCLDSIAAQSYPNVGLIVVSFKPVPGIDTLLEEYGSRFSSIKQIQSAPTGFRSTSLWDGLRAVSGDFFCNQDDDDSLHVNHIASLVSLAKKTPKAAVVYGGTIQVQDEPGNYYSQINYTGPLDKVIEESRSLHFFEPFQGERMLRYDNFVQSNTWMARSQVLKELDLVDPQLVVAEDMSLYFLLMRFGDFQFSWMPTANWHWRSMSKDNSMFMQTNWVESVERVQLRTQFFMLDKRYPANAAPPTVINGPSRELSLHEILLPFRRYGRRKINKVVAWFRSFS